MRVPIYHIAPLLARTSLRFGLGVGIVGMAAAGVAWATMQTSGGTITACYSNSTGVLRVIDASAATCKPQETALQWNVAGPTGPPGPEGTPFGLAESVIAPTVTPPTCAVTDVASIPLTITRNARLFVAGHGVLLRFSGEAFTNAQLLAALRDSSNAIVATATSPTYYDIVVNDSEVMNVDAVLHDGVGAPYTVTAGTYTLTMSVSLFGACDEGVHQFQEGGVGVVGVAKP